MAGRRKGTYKIRNWRKYNESLVQRGSITFWFGDDVIQQWHHRNKEAKVGHPFVYSDTAVECLLVLRAEFRGLNSGTHNQIIGAVGGTR